MKRLATLLIAIGYLAGQGFVVGHKAAERDCCVHSDTPSMACGEDGHGHDHHHHHRHATCTTCAKVVHVSAPEIAFAADEHDADALAPTPREFDASPELLAGAARAPPAVRL